LLIYVPDFYNWNRVKLRYCDGASFAGDATFDNGVILETKKFCLLVVTHLLRAAIYQNVSNQTFEQNPLLLGNRDPFALF
jgi:hypothetical protein